MADVATNIDGSSIERNGSAIVGAPRGTTASDAFTGPLASGYKLLPGDGVTANGSAVGGVNDAMDTGVLYAKYTNRFVYASGYPNA
jgi:hypothetical protein